MTGFDATVPHTFALWVIAILAVLVCSTGFITFVALTPSFWRRPEDGIFRSISRDRAEKSCDTVLSICALLIPATLGLLTWLSDKVGPASYILPLLCALLFFFILLVFTVYMRFNYLWSLGPEFLVSSPPKTATGQHGTLCPPSRNIVFACWLTTATSAIVLGLVLLTIPILELGFGLLKMKPAPPPAPIHVQCDCHTTAPPPPQPPPPPCRPCKPIRHRRHPRPPCACKK